MAYAPPAKDTVMCVGGLGTQADANSLNGGGATKAVWDANSPANFIDTNGGPIFTDAFATWTEASQRLTATGIGVGVLPGTLVYVGTGFGLHLTPGIYEVISIVSDNIIVVNVDTDGSDDIDVPVNVGGALDTLQNALDNDLNDATVYDRYILFNDDGYVTAATIDADTNAGLWHGSGAHHVHVIGVNSSLVEDGTRPIITTNSYLVAGLLRVTTVDGYYFKNLDFNGGGAGKANYGLYAAGSSDGRYSVIENCIVRSCSSHGIYYRGYGLRIVDCEMHSNGGAGYHSVSNILALVLTRCKIHDNSDHGVFVRPLQCVISHNQIYDNGTDSGDDGINCAYGYDSQIFNNTVYGNSGDGIFFDSTMYGIDIFNNSFSGNGAYGYFFETGSHMLKFINRSNHSHNNSSGHCNQATSDADWQAFADDNIIGDPLFVSVVDGSEDFTLQITSPLIDAGVGGSGDHIGALGMPLLTLTDAPVVTGVTDDGDGAGFTAAVTGTGTIQLYYKLRSASSWTTGSTRSGDGDIAQAVAATGWYDCYATATDGGIESGASNIETVYVATTTAESIEAAVVTILTGDIDVTTLVSSRIYPMAVPQGAAMPAITYQQITDTKLHHHGDPDTLVVTRLQVDCWGETYAAASGLKKAVRLALDGYTGTVAGRKIGNVIMENSTDIERQIPGTDKLKRYGKSLDFIIVFNEASS